MGSSLRPFSRKPNMGQEQLFHGCSLTVILNNTQDKAFANYSRTQQTFVPKTSWKQTKYLLVISVSNKSMFHKSIPDKSKANPKCVTLNPIISIFVLF